MADEVSKPENGTPILNIPQHAPSAQEKPLDQFCYPASPLAQDSPPAMPTTPKQEIKAVCRTDPPAALTAATDPVGSPTVQHVASPMAPEDNEQRVPREDIPVPERRSSRIRRPTQFYDASSGKWDRTNWK